MLCDISCLLVEGHMVNMLCFLDALCMLVLIYVTNSLQLCSLQSEDAVEFLCVGAYLSCTKVISNIGQSGT